MQAYYSCLQNGLNRGILAELHMFSRNRNYETPNLSNVIAIFLVSRLGRFNFDAIFG